jgi:hypothetical protein
MNDPEVEDLLQLARATAPRSGAKARLRGQVLAAGATAVAIGTVTSQAAGASALGAASNTGGGLFVSVLACLAGGAVGGYLVLAGVTPLLSPVPPKASPAVVRSPAPSAKLADVSVAPSAPVAVPAREPASFSVAVPVAAPAASNAAVPSIERETQLIADVQRALQRGDAEAALGELARYDAEFPRGALAEEASAARAVSWCKLGTKAPARQALNEFRSHFSSSPLAARVSAACRSLDGHVDFELEPEGSATQSGKRSAGSSARGRVSHE